MGCYYQYCPCQEAPASRADEIQRGGKKAAQKLKEKRSGESLICTNVTDGNCTSQTKLLSSVSASHYPTKCFLEKRLLQLIKNGSLFDNGKCFRKPEECRETSASFLPIFKNHNLGRDDIGPLIDEYTDKEAFSTQPRRILISCRMEQSLHRYFSLFQI